VAIAKQSSWNYHAAGNDLGVVWREVDYSDSGWGDGDGSLGNGIVGVATLLPLSEGGTNNPTTAYFRKEFVINDPLNAIANLRLEAMYDDGFVLYLNGVEVLRSASLPGSIISFSTPAQTSYNSVGYEIFDLSAHINRLRQGNNVIAVEVHQATGGPIDVLWDAALSFDVSTTPKVALPTITPNGGAFTSPALVTVSTTPADALIYYTLNGQEPDQLSTRYTAPFTIETTMQIRARAYTAGYNDSDIATATFTFTAPQPLNIALVSTATGFSLSINGEANARYIIERSVNLAAWSEMTTLTADAGGKAIYAFAPPFAETQMFYRCRPE
jgi:hypothetical protein